jgi:hypothetical protein
MTERARGARLEPTRMKTFELVVGIWEAARVVARIASEDGAALRRRTLANRAADRPGLASGHRRATHGEDTPRHEERVERLA